MIIQLYIKNPLVNRFIHMSGNASMFINTALQSYLADPNKKLELGKFQVRDINEHRDFSRRHYKITVTKENLRYIDAIPKKKRTECINLILSIVLSIPAEWLQEEYNLLPLERKINTAAVPAAKAEPEEESIIIEGSVDEADVGKDYSVTQPESQITEITEAQDINDGTDNDYAETSMEKKWDKYTIQDEWKLSDDYVIGALGNLNNMD